MFFLQFKMQQEGFDYQKISDVYVFDAKHSSYVPLDSDVYDNIVSGAMKL